MSYLLLLIVIEDYGVLSRKPTLNPILLEKGKNILTQFGFVQQYHVQQQNCYYKDISQRPALHDYHCLNVDKEKNIDLIKVLI